MSNDPFDNDNPFAPSRRSDTPAPQASTSDDPLSFSAHSGDRADPDPLDDDMEPELPLGARLDDPDEDDFEDDGDDWDGYDAEYDGEYDGEEEQRPGLLAQLSRQPWPLGMIAIAVFALLLLVVGGFGVMRERAALKEEIRELRSQLAEAVSPDQLTTERNTHRDLVEQYEALQEKTQALQLENRQLTDTVRGLEQQQAAQQAVVDATVPSQPQKAPAQAAQPAAATATEGNWFVNFSSYSQRELADSWARRIKPTQGEVVVSAAPGGDLFRVRVVSLPDKATAQAIADTLQEQYGLAKLWVGEE